MENGAQREGRSNRTIALGRCEARVVVMAQPVRPAEAFDLRICCTRDALTNKDAQGGNSS